MLVWFMIPIAMVVGLFMGYQIAKASSLLDRLDRERAYMQVDVYHNVAVENGFPLGVLDGFQPHHMVTKVATLELTGGLIDDVLGSVFTLLNVGDDPHYYPEPDPQALKYREAGNRSLSVGDVVSVHTPHSGEQWYAVERVGWARILHPTLAYPKDLLDNPRPGTVPLLHDDCPAS